MRVICRANNFSSFTDKYLLSRLAGYISNPDGEVDLELGKEYTVYGVVFWDNSPWYYLCVEEDDEYPRPFAAEFFGVLDGRLSSYWRLSTVSQENGGILSSLVFDEWAKDPLFYENLLDDEINALEIFKKYRQLMNQEWFGL